MQHVPSQQALFLALTLLLIHGVVRCGNADSRTEVTVQQETERRTLTASESTTTAQVTLRITGLS